MKIKNKITSLFVGGLVLSAPLATFAADSEDKKLNERNFDLSNEERLELIKESLDLQIEHANLLVESLDDSLDVDKDRLLEIIEEYSNLEEFLDSVDVEGKTKEELRETFFEFREDSKELSSEFKSIIKEAFNSDERSAFREQFREDREELREKFGLPEKKERKYKPRLSIEQIEKINPDIASRVESGELERKDAMKELRTSLKEMDKEERKALFEEAGIERPKYKFKERLNE